MSDEAAHYARMSWQRFDDKITDELLRAVTSAFALVAVADGDLASAEDDQFLSMLADHADIFSPLNLNTVDALFRDICGAILSDPAAGHSHALQEIAIVQDNQVHAELVRAAAEIAMAADQRLANAETRVMAEICTALKLTPR
ncbi:MAG: TerB family tellurite resistance protein [Pseudomonadota bacterium]